MRDKIIIFSFLLIFFSSFVFPATNREKDIDDLIAQLQESLKMKDITSYLENFSPEVRKEEEEEIRNLFGKFQIEDVALFKVKKGINGKGKFKIYLQALFQNSYFVVIETWQLALAKEKDRWQIKEKKVVGEVKELYRIKMPSDRVEKVDLIEIDHVDIKLTFKDAILFYDNIPGFETALLIIGNGHLYFSPSDPKEKHQLELLYKNRFLVDKLNYAYLRFSDFFFKTRIRIVRREKNKSYQVPQSEKNRAYSLFIKNYPRSFTIENSLNGELLSFLPRGDEAVFEFEGQKIGKFAYIYSPFAREEVNLYQWKEGKIISLYSPKEAEKARKLYFSFGQMFDVESYKIAIDFNPLESYISGKATVEIKPLVKSLDGVKFKFNPSLEILRIFDEERRQLFYTRDKLRKILYIYFFQHPPQGKSYFIEIFYRGKLIPPKQIADVIAGPQFNESVIYVPPKYGTFLYSHSSYWYPSPPGVDYFKARLKIIIPPQYTCIANGELVEKTRLTGVEKVEEIEKMGNSVYIFQTKYPIKYISFVVGKFIEVEKELFPLPFRFLKSLDLRYQKRGFLKQAKDILRFYESKFGPYPYEKLSIVQRVWPTSGGHSPASFIVLNDLIKVPGKGPYINVNSPVDFSRWKEYFIAHEIAHQWWGQGVTWKTYHDQWLSEGLAQFSSILYLREKYGDKAFSSILKKLSRWTEKKSEWGSITMGSRLSYFDFDAYQSIVYDKSSLVLNMLKDLLGEEPFFRGLRKFFADYKYRAASTNDFFKEFKEISEYDLASFFKEWFDSHSLPLVRVSHSLQKREGKYLLEFTVSQQSNFFTFPLWVEWNTNGEKIIKKVLVNKRSEKFVFKLKSKPKKIRINSNRAVPWKFY